MKNRCTQNCKKARIDPYGVGNSAALGAEAEIEITCGWSRWRVAVAGAGGRGGHSLLILAGVGVCGRLTKNFLRALEPNLKILRARAVAGAFGMVYESRGSLVSELKEVTQKS